MGARFEFICPNCDYGVQVSGCLDFGFVGVTVTITCEDCRALYDMQVKDVKAYEVPDGYKPDRLECPVSAEHRVRKWKYPGKCPKCNAPMSKES